MPSLTEKKNEELRKRGIKVGVGARLWGKIDIRGNNRIAIGDYTCLAENVFVISHCPIRGMSEETLKTNIGHDVWVGYGSIILPGVTIGNRALIGAGSVVTKDVKPDCIYAGNPAKFIRERDKREVVRTHLLIKQNLVVSVPDEEPEWDITEEEILKLFDISMEQFDDNYRKLLS